MSSKRKLSHFHSCYRKKISKKKCPGCNQLFSSQYFKSHEAEYLHNDRWLCCKESDSESEAVYQEIPEIDSSGSLSSSEDDRWSKNHLSQQMNSLLKKKLRSNVHSSDLLENLSDSDDEIWNDVTELDIESDLAVSNKVNLQCKPGLKTSSLVLWLCIFFCYWQASHVIPDTAINSALSFLSTFFHILSPESALIAGISTIFPCSVYMLWKTLGLQRDNFRRYVVCKKCYALYKLDECEKVLEGVRMSATCTNIIFPNHPQLTRRRPCGELLLKTVQLCSGRKKLYPFKTYCYKPVQETLKRLVNQENFEDNCEKWRNRKQQPGYLTDVYDGRIWKEFQSDDKKQFLKTPKNYGLMINLDWFQPFEHVQYSVGVIYAVVMNLPREERFKMKNVLLIGIIPDMNREPSVNSFLEPLVDELKVAWETGFEITSFNSKKTNTTFKCAVMCVGCDIPATRKLCGFLGHNARLGCSKCYKEFKGTVGNMDYSGFDITNWTERKLETHKKILQKLQKAKTQTQLETLERKYGVRQSILCVLEYFDPIRMSVVDPMHNLFQGTAKKVMKFWIDNNILRTSDLQKIQQKVDSVDVACSIGAIPRKIASSFGGFTAEQWMNWTNIFSIFALKDILPNKDLEIWRNFVLASRVVTSKFVTEVDVKEFEKHIINFCKQFEAEYGRSAVTPNMHMHFHLAKCVQDYGPVYSFWLFSFERYNGHLGSLPNNNRSIEIQLMRRFNRDSFVSSIAFPDLYISEFSLVLDKVNSSEGKNTVPVSSFDVLRILYMASKSAPVIEQEWHFTQVYSFSKMSNKFFDEENYTLLQATYRTVYPNLAGDIERMPMSYRRCTSVSLGKEVYGSWHSRHRRSSVIMAYWHTVRTGAISTDQGFGELVPGIIQEFIFHNLLGKENKLHIFARVVWFQKLPEMYQNHCGKPVEAWCKDLYDVKGTSTFLPVQRIFCKCVRAEGQILQKNVHFIFPLSNKIGI